MKLNKFLLAVTISIFLLAGAWQLGVYLYEGNVTSFPLVGVGTAGFLGWATFYAAGGKLEGLTKGLFANLSGVFWGLVIAYLMLGVFGYNWWGNFLAVAIGAGAMCFQAHVKQLGFIPGAFIGASTYFAIAPQVSWAYLPTIYPAVIGLVAGLVLGYISEQFAIFLNAKLSK